MSRASVAVDDLPIATHTYVLGADIHVAQQATESGEYPGHRTRETAVRVEAYEGESFQAPSRRYLAAWARRALFSGGAAS